MGKCPQTSHALSARISHGDILCDEKSWQFLIWTELHLSFRYFAIGTFGQGSHTEASGATGLSAALKTRLELWSSSPDLASSDYVIPSPIRETSLGAPHRHRAVFFCTRTLILHQDCICSRIEWSRPGAFFHRKKEFSFPMPRYTRGRPSINQTW